MKVISLFGWTAYIVRPTKLQGPGWHDEWIEEGWRSWDAPFVVRQAILDARAKEIAARKVDEEEGFAFKRDEKEKWMKARGYGAKT